MFGCESLSKACLVSGNRSARLSRPMKVSCDSKLWVELEESQDNVKMRLGLDDIFILGGTKQGSRAFLFVPVAESNWHFTIIGDPKSQRITFHETIEHVDTFDGIKIPWNENAKAAFVLNVRRIERQCSQGDFLAECRTRMVQACRFIRRPSDFRGKGIRAVFPTPTGKDLRPVSGTRYELQLSAFGPEPVEALWRARPGVLFFALGNNLKLVGVTTLLEDGRCVLLYYRDAIAILDWLIRALSEPASPPRSFCPAL